MTKLTLIEKMERGGVPRSWLTDVRRMESSIKRLRTDKHEYSLLIDALAREKEGLEIENASTNKRIAEYEDRVPTLIAEREEPPQMSKDPWADVRIVLALPKMQVFGKNAGPSMMERLLADADALLGVVNELGDGGDLINAADLLQEATNEHGVDQSFNNNPYDLSDRLRKFAQVIAALPVHLIGGNDGT